MFGKHLAAALAATAVDFAVMVLLVERLGIAPELATLVGALVGAAVNFWLGRAWVYRARAGARVGQALRYAVVSATGAGLNALGEHFMLVFAGAHYAAARVLVAVGASVLWSYPMQRYVVFAPRRGLEVDPHPGT